MLIQDSKNEYILMATKKASRSLQQILDDPSIHIALASGEPKEVIKQDYQTQWKQSKFSWEYSIRNSSLSSSFVLALYASDTLSGLCENQIVEHDNTIEILVIEESPISHPLKHYVISAFSQANLEIAKEINLKEISVYNPKPWSVPSYERLGYRNQENIPSCNRPVVSNVPLDWSAVFAHQHAKGRTTPKNDNPF